MNLQNVYVGRQPILDGDGKIYAYELLFRSGKAAAGSGVTRFNEKEATARVLINALNNIGVANLLGDKQGFINMNEELLNEEFIRLLPKEQFVLEILETVEVNDAFITRVKELKEEGYRFALDDFVFDEKYMETFAPLMGLVEVIKVEVLGAGDDVLREKMALFRKYPVKLLAEKVEDQEMFDLCHGLGYTLFQGYFFAKPVVIEEQSIEPGKLAILKLLGLLRSDVPIQTVEEEFKHHPSMSVSLLKYLNSASFGMKRQITSIQHAITLLGRNKLTQWLMLLSFAGPGFDDLENPLLLTAELRGRTMEALAARCMKGAGMKEEAFMCGMLSLMDVVFQAPKEKILDELNLDQVIRDAVLEEKGPLGSLLALQIAAERDEMGSMAQALEELHIDLGVFAQVRLECMTAMEAARNPEEKE